jgi:hypothetical protein
MGDLSLLNSNIVNVSQNVENSARYIRKLHERIEALETKVAE